MAFLQNVDIGTLLFISIGCVLLCVFGLVLFFGLQLLGTTLHTFVGLAELFGGIVNGGPVAWCGCALLLFICAGVVGTVVVVVSCNTNPSAMNFCLLLPK
jgi:hypothetical protein